MSAQVSLPHGHSSYRAPHNRPRWTLTCADSLAKPGPGLWGPVPLVSAVGVDPSARAVKGEFRVMGTA